MLKGSVKRPLFLYSGVFLLGFAVSLITLASVSLLRLGRQTHAEATRNLMRQLASAGDVESVSGLAEALSRGSDKPIYVVTKDSSEGPLGLWGARQAALVRPADGWSAEPITNAEEEAYVVYHVDSSPGALSASREVRRLTLMGIVGALAFSVVLGFMISRLVLPPILSLRKVAEDALSQRGLPPTDAPNEVAEVARSFLTTIRALDADRKQLRAQHDELEKMQAGLVRASKLASVGRLAAGIAHEIGNPLAAVLGYLSLLKNEMSSAEQQDILERISRELNRIHETIQKLLTYARQEEPKEDELEAVDVKEVVDETLELLSGHPEMRTISVVNDTEALPEGVKALGHEGPLGQVLVNLMLNAAYALRGKEGPKIEISATVEDSKVEILVQDNGPGIKKEVAEQIFDPFFTSKPPGEGTGLGLAVSRSLMSRMGGDLTVEAPGPNPGATFKITLKTLQA